LLRFYNPSQKRRINHSHSHCHHFTPQTAKLRCHCGIHYKGAFSLRSATSWCARHTRASADCKHYKYWCCKSPVQFLLAMPIRVDGQMDSLLLHSVIARNKSSNVRACKAMHNIFSLSLAASAAAFVHRPVGEQCENLTCLAHKMEFVHICTSHWNTCEM